MSSGAWARARFAVVAVTLVFLVWRLGTGPFVAGLRTVDAKGLAAATIIGVPITVACAWRWKLVARGLGIDLNLRAAVAAYYRSQFLNVSLPGGVVGDVHRGISNGRDVADVGKGLRAVAWERTAGQLVQAVLTVGVLIALPSPVRSYLPPAAAALGLLVAGVVLLVRVRPRAGRAPLTRLRNAVAGDIRDGLLARRAWVGIAAASAVAVAGHIATFLIAARTAGVGAPVSRLLPLALLVMLAMVLPNVAGWGPREGFTAWAFAAAGLGADSGIATAVVFGVMVFVSSLPGAVVLLAAWARSPQEPEAVLARRSQIAVLPDRVPHG
jgi:uncharacterized membrane protein YbhN (UPF0104 family)